MWSPVAVIMVGRGQYIFDENAGKWYIAQFLNSEKKFTQQVIAHDDDDDDGDLLKNTRERV